jgi:hypothetical protein
LPKTNVDGRVTAAFGMMRRKRSRFARGLVAALINRPKRREKGISTYPTMVTRILRNIGSKSATIRMLAIKIKAEPELSVIFATD